MASSSCAPRLAIRSAATVGRCWWIRSTRSVADGKRIATGTVKLAPGKGKTSYAPVALDLVGDAIVLISRPTDASPDTPRTTQLLRVAKGKVKTVGALAGEVTDWTAIGGGRGAFVIDRKVAVVELATGKVTATLPWQPLVDPPRDNLVPSELQVAGTGVAGEVAITVYDADDRLAGAGVYAGDVPRLVTVPLCAD